MQRQVIDPASVCVRFSTLKNIRRSPAHYYHAVQCGGMAETLSMRIGSGAHAKIFGTPEIVVYRGGVLDVEKVKKGRKGKKGAPDEPDTIEIVKKPYTDVRNGALWEKFQEDHAGKLILNEKEDATAESMARALTTHLVADPLMFSPGTKHEHRIEADMMGRRCSGILDALGLQTIVDLKGVKDSSPRWFPLQARTMAWHAQAQWYADLCLSAGLGEREPYLIAVENTAPHAVQVYRLTDRDRQDGRRLWQSWLTTLLECEAADRWPSYADDVLDLNIMGTAPVAEPDDDDLESSSEAA